MPDPTPLGDTDFLRTARARFKLADDADTKQRERERNDLAFYAGDQWPADIKLLRQGQQPTNGMPAVPARPTLVINNVREPVRQILNEERASDLAIEIIAADDFGDLNVTPDETEIKLREGLVRRIQRQSSAAEARTWAYARAVIAGRGYYMIRTRFLPVNPNAPALDLSAWDQEIYIDRIYDQASVLLDPSHQQPDGSDAEWEFVSVDMLWDKYAAKYPKGADGRENAVVARIGDSDDQWRAIHDELPDWFQDITDAEKKTTTKAVRVTDYFYVSYTTKELSVLSDGRVMWSTDVPKGEKVADTRMVDHRVVKHAKIDGVQILEETELPAANMPIIKVLGEELQPYDEQRRAEGMVRPSRDAQMGLNYMISKQVETVGLTPIPPLQVDPDAIEGFEEWYKVANTRALPYLPARTYDDQGRPLKEPHRPAVDPNLLPISQSIALFGQFVEKTTAVPAARLGDIDPVTRSGKALQTLTQNSQQSTSNFLDNLVRSERCEGEVINNWLYPIYGSRPGRLVRIMTGEGQNQIAMVTPDAQQQQMDQALAQKAQMVAKLTPDAHFNVVIKVTRNFDTRRQELETTLGEIIAHDPQYGMSVFGDLFFKYSDAPGHQEMAERARVMLAPPVQQMLAAQARGGQFDPKDVQIQQLQGALQQAHQVIQGKTAEKQVEQQGKMAITQVQEQHEDMRAALDRETKIAVAELGAKVDRLQLFLEERGRIGANVHEATEAGLDRQHEQGLAAQDAALQQNQQEHDSMNQQADRTHEANQSAADMEMQAQQAAQPQQAQPA